MIMDYLDIPQNGNLWWKILNLIKIKNIVNIPRWFVITNLKEINEANKYYKNKINSDFYICRSSMDNEDWLELSYAWLFESIEWKYYKKNLTNDIKTVFLSLNNNYLDEYEKSVVWKITRNRKMSVLIQEFIIWDISWIYFSKFNWGKIIEYVKWCNQFMVNWIIKSNKIVLDRNNNIIEHKKNVQYKYIWKNLDIFIYNKVNNCLKQNILKKLLFTLNKIEAYFEYKIDVEWTISNWEIYILQVRPITK